MMKFYARSSLRGEYVEATRWLAVFRGIVSGFMVVPGHCDTSTFRVCIKVFSVDEDVHCG